MHGVEFGELFSVHFIPHLPFHIHSLAFFALIWTPLDSIIQVLLLYVFQLGLANGRFQEEIWEQEEREIRVFIRADTHPTELQIGSGWVLLEPWLLLSDSFQKLQVSLGSHNFAFPLAPSGLSIIVAFHPY